MLSPTSSHSGLSPFLSPPEMDRRKEVVYGAGHSPSRGILISRASIMFLIGSDTFMSHVTQHIWRCSCFGPHRQVWSQPHGLDGLVFPGCAGQSVSARDEDIGYINIFS